MALTIPYTPATLQTMAEDFRRGQPSVATIQFIEALVRALRDLDIRLTALEARPVPHTEEGPAAH